MGTVQARRPLDDARASIGEAIQGLTATGGDDRSALVACRRALAALDAIPAEAVLVTPDQLAAAILRGWPARRNTPTNAELTARTILAALRTLP